jgi:GH43 family beta-xylosidase
MNCSRGRISFALLAATAWLAACVPAGRAVTPAPGATGASAGACTFTNPIAPGADPWLEFRDGWYYMAQSTNPGEGQPSTIWVFRSRKLTDPMRDSVKVWTSPASGWNQTHVWAPEIRHVDGRWYIYYAAGRPGPQDAPFIYQRAGALRASGGDPFAASWEDMGQLDTGGDVGNRADDVWAIDFTVHRLGGQLYGMWSGWNDNTPVARTPQYLYIARMTNPWTVGGPRSLISAPEESWERRVDPTDGLDLNEGPQVLERNGNVFIIYSTRESWTPAYRLGQLRLRPGADPMQRASWTKSGPVFQQANDVYGPGHNGFAKSPDGTEDWVVYHAKVDTGPNWNRVIRAQRFTWRPDGSPDFGQPVASGVPLPVPSGEPCER